MRWLEGFERWPNWPRVLPTPAGSPCRRPGMRYPRIQRSGTPATADRLAGSDGHPRNRCLPRVTISGTDWRWPALVLGGCASSSQPGRRRPVGGADGADRTGHAAPGRRRTRDGDRAASREESPPAGVEPLDGLLSNQPADALDQATEWIQWYGTRWVSKFFRIFKPVAGWKPCNREHPGATGNRPRPYLIIAWRIQSLTLLGRAPELPCDAVLDPANGKRSMSPLVAGPAGDPAAVAGHARLIATRRPSGS